MIQPAMVRNRRRVAALAVMALVIGANLSMFFLVVQYVQRVLGFGPLAAGVAFLPFSLGIFAMSRVTPRLLARFGAALDDHGRHRRPGRRATPGSAPSVRRTPTSARSSGR